MTVECFSGFVAWQISYISYRLSRSML